MRKEILLLLVVFSSLQAFSQSSIEAARKKNFNLSKAVALSGYDAVAYFTQNKAVEGNAKISSDYQGVTYYFSSETNKEQFKKSPASYEPQYGGWCAYAMGSTGEKVEVDPATFKIINGKLYLFYNKFFNNTLKSWNKDEAKVKAKADTNWTNIFK